MPYVVDHNVSINNGKLSVIWKMKQLEQILKSNQFLFFWGDGDLKILDNWFGQLHAANYHQITENVKKKTKRLSWFLSWLVI